MIREDLAQRIDDAGGVAQAAMTTKLSVATIYRALRGETKPATTRYIALALAEPHVRVVAHR